MSSSRQATNNQIKHRCRFCLMQETSIGKIGEKNASWFQDRGSDTATEIRVSTCTISNQSHVCLSSTQDQFQFSRHFRLISVKDRKEKKEKKGKCQTITLMAATMPHRRGRPPRLPIPIPRRSCAPRRRRGRAGAAPSRAVQQQHGVV